MTETKSRKGTAQSLAKKRDKLLSLLGAVIVFVTFVTKEGLREKFKDSLDSTSEGIKMFLLRADIGRLAGQLEALRADTLRPLLKRGAKVMDKEVIDFAGDFDARLRESMGSILASLDNASRLLSSMDKADNDLVKLRSRSMELDASVRQLETILVNDIHAELKHEPVPAGDGVKLLSFFDASVQAASLEADVFDFAYRLSSTADNWRKVQERRYDETKWASYALYVVGWGVGLLGTLSGDKGTGVDAG